jgi:hypothetical protein
MGRIWDGLVAGWRWFCRLIGVVVAISLVGNVAIWIAGSVHAGHIMDTDELDRLSAQLLQWLIAHRQ